MTTGDLSYPVIQFDRDGYCMVAVDEDVLTTMNSCTLKHGGLVGSTIADSNGRAAKVKEIRRVRPKGGLFGFRIWLDRVWRVEFTLDEPFEVPLEGLRSVVLRDMRRGGVSIDADYLRAEFSKIKSAGSIREIIEIMLPHADLRGFW